MTDVDIRPIDCLAPIIGVIVGFGLGVLVAKSVPSQWQSGELAFWAPRLLGLVASVYFWGIGTLARGNRLYCGGLMRMSDSDKTRYWIGGTIAFFAYTGLMLTYANAHLLGYLVLMFLLLAAFVGEVGWGRPLHGINVLSNHPLQDPGRVRPRRGDVSKEPGAVP